MQSRQLKGLIRLRLHFSAYLFQQSDQGCIVKRLIAGGISGTIIGHGR
jgi:hypothetical protein